MALEAAVRVAQTSRAVPQSRVGGNTVEGPGASTNKRGVFLTVMAALFVVLGISDCTKVLQHHRSPNLGMVVFGHRFTSTVPNVMVGILFGVILFAYAYGIWSMRRWVLPLAIVYAFYVPVNLVLFWSQSGLPPPPVGSILGYLAVAFTGSIG